MFHLFYLSSRSQCLWNQLQRSVKWQLTWQAVREMWLFYIYLLHPQRKCVTFKPTGREHGAGDFHFHVHHLRWMGVMLLCNRQQIPYYPLCVCAQETTYCKNEQITYQRRYKGDLKEILHLCFFILQQLNFPFFRTDPSVFNWYLILWWQYSLKWNK